MLKMDHFWPNICKKTIERSLNVRIEEIVKEEPCKASRPGIEGASNSPSTISFALLPLFAKRLPITIVAIEDEDIVFLD